MSQVTDPVLLDSTGQDIVDKLQDIVDAINGGTIDPLTVTANDIYTPPSGVLGYAPVTVNVPSSGGETPTLLSHSDPNDILANSYYTGFDGTSWGDLSVTGTPTTRAMGIKTASGNGFSLDLGADNTDATIYAIVRGYADGDKFPLGFSYALSTGNTIAYMTRSGKWYAGVWGSDTDSSTAYNTLAVLAIAVDCTAKRAYFYINGTALTDKSFNNCGRTVRFNGSTSFADRAGEFDYIFAGVVAGCESAATVIANQQDMLTVLANGRILIPV